MIKLLTILVKKGIIMRLFIIGNGFDLNHGYKSSYLEYKKYLLSHREYTIGSFHLSDFFEDDDEMWSDFENNLEYVNFKQNTNFYLGELTEDMSDKEWEREYSRRSSLQDSFEETPDTILPAICESLSDFICETTEKNAQHKDYFKKIMTNNDSYITFNYSKTLEKIYNISSSRIDYIHGIAHKSFHKDPDNIDGTYEDPAIIFGHGNLSRKQYVSEESNPFNPNACLVDLNKYLEKQYQINEFENFVMTSTFSKIEIIGHDLGPVDLPYFDVLKKYVHNNEIINYWLWDKSKQKQKYELLKQLFPNNHINIVFYP